MKRTYKITDKQCWTAFWYSLGFLALCILLSIPLYSQTSEIVEIGSDVTLIWGEKISTCDGCPKSPRPDHDVFHLIQVDSNGDTWYNTGRDTTCKVFNIQENTSFYALASYLLPDSTRIYSNPSDTVYAWVTEPIEGVPAIFEHDFIKIRDKWAFVPNEIYTHKDKGVTHCLTANPGPVAMSLKIGVDTDGEYLFRFEGWRYSDGSLILSVDDYVKDGIFQDGSILFPAVLEVGTHNIEVIAQGTSACFSLIRSSYLTQNPQPSNVEGLGIQ